MTKESTKRKKALETLAALGIDTAILESVATEHSNEAEAVLEFINRRGRGFHDVTCKHCLRRFSTDLNHVSYCSNVCRAKALKEVGIEWDAAKPETERWRSNRLGSIPHVVPPPALSLVEDTIHSLIALLQEVDAPETQLG